LWSTSLSSSLVVVSTTVLIGDIGAIFEMRHVFVAMQHVDFATVVILEDQL
jgi:hypothetical protein